MSDKDMMAITYNYVYSVAQDKYFLQDCDETDADSFDVFGVSNFGLIHRKYETDEAFDPDNEKTQWQRFVYHITSLNQALVHTNIVYKVLFLGRHGEGDHNVAEAMYGTKAWDDYWSLLKGNDTLSWEDPHLTDIGKQQAKRAHDAWVQQLESGLPYPEASYVSPLYRCLQTAQITFEGLKKTMTTKQKSSSPSLLLCNKLETQTEVETETEAESESQTRTQIQTQKSGFDPIVKELLRETLHVHTCDKRSSLSTITSDFPHYIIEPGFAEDDPLWQPDNRETDDERDQRLQMCLDDIVLDTTSKFNEDDDDEHDDNHNKNTKAENIIEATFISLSTHSGAITSLLQILGHRSFKLLPGSMAPVVVRVERVKRGNLVEGVRS